MRRTRKIILCVILAAFFGVLLFVPEPTPAVTIKKGKFLEFMGLPACACPVSDLWSCYCIHLE